MTRARSNPLRPRASLGILALGFLLTACGGGAKDGSTTPPPPPVLTTVVVALSVVAIQVGQTSIATATGLDQNGAPISVGSVAWSSASPTIATVSASGAVSAVAAGQSQIIATAGAKQGQLTLTVTPVSVSFVLVNPASATLSIGSTIQLTASPLDAAANPLPGRLVTWTASDSSKVRVSATGLVTAIAAGSANITAISEGKSGIAVVTVTGSSTIVTLVAPGQSIAFLTSPNFSTSLRLQPGSQHLIAVVNTDLSNTIREDFTLSGGLQSTSAAASSDGDIPTLAQTLNRASIEPGPKVDLSRQGLADIDRVGRSAANHVGILEDNRRIFARLGNPRALLARLQAQGGRSAPMSALVTPTIGTVNKVYVKKALGGSCTAVDSIGARTVAVGQRVIVLADTNRTTWPQNLRPDSSFYQTLANEFDQVTWPHTLAFIGNPLGYDASLSSIGKVTVTLTPVLNNFAGGTGGGSIVAFVNLCDFFPFVASGSQANFSNQTEIFYHRVPSATNPNIASWQKALRATAVHEVKHIVSFTDRILNDSPVLEEVWLEEGLAQLSSEIWQRNFNQATWKGHATFLQTVACEFNFGSGAPCNLQNNKPVALMGSHLPFFFSYLQNQTALTSGGLGRETPAAYGASWTFARWATDQYASAGEGVFVKSLINDPQLSGLANLSLHTGQPIPLLLVYWNVATAIFQLPAYTAADVRTTIPSFDFADIFNVSQTQFTCSGMPCGLFTDSGTPVFPVQAIPFSAGTYSRLVTGVPGTSASFFLLSGSAAGVQNLKLLSGNGGQLSPASGFRVAILRVR